MSTYALGTVIGIQAQWPNLTFFGSSPLRHKPNLFPELVGAISPSFIEIYDQAIAAEAANLNQIVGIGLRKSLEFLIKDYAIGEEPTKANEIRNTPLAACIDKYIHDANVKQVATRATWLGNDETHYTRKWLDRDIDDLKRLVKLTVNWVDNALTTKAYITQMPSKP